MACLLKEVIRNAGQGNNFIIETLPSVSEQGEKSDVLKTEGNFFTFGLHGVAM